jgi:hypothetical protein
MTEEGGSRIGFAKATVRSFAGSVRGITLSLAQRVSGAYDFAMRRLLQSLAFVSLSSSIAVSVCAQTPASQKAQQSVDQQVNVEILSDTRGVQLDSYLGSLVAGLKQGFVSKESAAGTKSPALHSEVDLLITIAADGQIAALKLETGTQDSQMAKAAWVATRDSAYAPLPVAFAGSPLQLRIRFVVG